MIVKTLRAASLLAALLVVAAPTASPALGAEAAPALSVSSLPTPTNFVPGDTEGEYTYDLRVANLGAAATDGSDITITDTLPAGLTVTEVKMEARGKPAERVDISSACDAQKAAEVETVTCTLSESLPKAEEPATIFPGEERRVVIHVLTPGSAVEGETLTNHVEVEGGGAPPTAVTTQNRASSQPAGAGITYFHPSLTGLGGQPVTQAGSHPYQMVSTSFAVNTRPAPAGNLGKFIPAGGDLKDIGVTLPPGLAGNPNAAQRCTALQFSTTHTINLPSSFYSGNACPDGSAVGIVLVQQVEGEGGILPVPLYNLVPPPGMPALLGFQLLNLPFYIDTEVRADQDYRVVGVLRNLTQVKRLTASTVVLWGTPADPLHDALRGSCLNELPEFFPISLGDCSAGISPKPFLRLPTSCAHPLETELKISNWTEPEATPLTDTDVGSTPSGCNQLEFEPTLEARPTTDVADSPSGLNVDLHVPQNESPEGLGTADLRSATVTLPKGISINPSSANGLAACSPSDIGLSSAAGTSPPRFSAGESHCPAAARIGSAEVDTPLIDHPLKGGVYVATPHQNPFGSLLALYIAVDDAQSGIHLKLAGEVHADPATGQLTTTFAENPQQPFEDFKLSFFGGAAAALRTPSTCGQYSTVSALTPWSAPESGPPATPSDSYEISKAPSGGSCPSSEDQQPNSPTFDAGTEAPIAAAYSPFVMHLRREDGSQELGGLEVTMPPGFSGRLAGVPYCPEAALIAAEAKSGAAEKASPSCPNASKLGTVTVGAGAGPAPYYTTGSAYLTGPYKGAPISLAILTPATAGPYDLGTVVTRVALHVDPESAQIRAVSDPLPHLLQGIPLDIRSITLRLDRSHFTVNPTSCNAMAVAGRASSVFGQVASLSDRFQVGECGRLAFKPKLSLRLKGKTNRGGHPALTATLTMPEGGANIARATVALPHSEFIDQGHFQTICTRVQYAEGAVPGERCPPKSIYGHVTAYSPLLEAPLSGPVYLRSSTHELPDLVLSLNGQIHVDAVGHVDSVHGGIRTSFEAVPDAAVSKLVLTMQGGGKGLFQNSTNICKGAHRASAIFAGQNGKAAESRPKLIANCKGDKHSKPNRKHHGHKRAVG
jgi:hypothetical protein